MGKHFIDRFLTDEEYAWLTDKESAQAKVVVCVESENELQDIFASAFARGLTAHKIIDAGRTEFDGVPTLTCVSIGPHDVEKFTGLTDHLKLM
jgi:PTH2 family peptidyl-tRNA hydrolase